MSHLLYIDSSYTLDQIRERDMDHVLRIRHLDGLWSKIWSVHPVDMHPGMGQSEEAYGKPIVEKITPDHFFVRGRFGRFSFLKAIKPINALLSLLTLILTMRKIVQSNDIRVIRAGDPLLSGILGIIVSRLTGAKLVVRINGDHDMLRKNTGTPIMPNLFRTASVESFVERCVCSRADIIISPSPNYSDFAISKGADPDRCHLVRYGNLIDPRHLAPVSDRPEIEDQKLRYQLSQRPYLLHVGRLAPLKHVEDCLEVLGLLHQDGVDAGLCLAGDGPLRNQLEERATELGVLDRLQFLGNCTQGFLAQLVPHCAGVLSPLTGRALTEVAFGEASIVAYDLDWQSELVVNEVSGLLVPAHDIRAMADGAARILGDQELAKKLGRGARHRAFELLEPDLQTKLEIKAYQTLDAFK